MTASGIKRYQQYIDGVLDGSIPTNLLVKQAIVRQVSDLKRIKDKKFLYTFDEKKAERAIKFIELNYHTKGKWAANNMRITLEPWQCFFIACLFGWVTKKFGLRRFRKALLLVPRKNGKSILAAVIGLLLFAADGEYGAEVYSGATTEKQAWEVFRPAQLMARNNPDLCSAFDIDVHASRLVRNGDNSRFQPVIGKPGDGASPSCAIIDEYHEHDTDTLFDTMETGMGAREQPLMLVITTAGSNLSGPCYQLQLDAESMLNGTIENDQMLALIYGIDKDDDWTSDEALIKANPNYDISVSAEFLKEQRKQAVASARKQNIFRTKHLNEWVGARDAYFNAIDWKECGDLAMTLDQFDGRECIVSLDLASKVDIAAMSILFPLENGEYAAFNRSYLPSATIEEGTNEHYRTWKNEGWIIETEGEIIDFERIFDDVMDLSRRFTITNVAYDPHQATMMVNALMAEGVPCIEVRPTILNFSDPMKMLDGLMKAKRIKHNGDPCLAWMISNVTTKEDARGNVYPRKERPESKIDGAVALIAALAVALNEESNQSYLASSPLAIV